MVELDAKMVPDMYRAPVPVLRVWLFLLAKYPEGYSGTPGLLWEEMREDGLIVARRSMSDSLTQLATLGMMVSRRHGHHVEIWPVK